MTDRMGLIKFVLFQYVTQKVKIVVEVLSEKRSAMAPSENESVRQILYRSVASLLI